MRKSSGRLCLVCVASGQHTDPRSICAGTAALLSRSPNSTQVLVVLLPDCAPKFGQARSRPQPSAIATRTPRIKTILSNQNWRSWTPSGFGSRFNDAKQASGIEVHLHDLRGTFATRCMTAGLTDQEIANILGWTTKQVATIRVKYVDQARVVVAIAKRLAKVSV